MAAARMPPLSLRRLTAGERALAAEMFGAGLDAGRIRLLALPLWRRAFVAGPALIVWPARDACADLSAPGVALRAQATLIHELTHVWQAQHGVSLLFAKLRAGDRPASYAYDLRQGPAFLDMNIEQQASVVEHAFLVSRGAAAPHEPELYAQASTAWRSG